VAAHLKARDYGELFLLATLSLLERFCLQQLLHSV